MWVSSPTFTWTRPPINLLHLCLQYTYEKGKKEREIVHYTFSWKCFALSESLIFLFFFLFQTARPSDRLSLSMLPRKFQAIRRRGSSLFPPCMAWLIVCSWRVYSPFWPLILSSQDTLNPRGALSGFLRRLKQRVPLSHEWPVATSG